MRGTARAVAGVGGRRLIDHWPSAAAAATCSGGRAGRLGEPARHQVEELPLIAVSVTEHRCQRVRCPGCGASAPASCRPSRRAHSGPVCKRRSWRSRFVTVSRAATRSSSAKSSFGRACRRARSTRSSRVPATRSRSPTSSCWRPCAPARALNMDETGWRLKGSQRASGACSPTSTPFSSRASRHEDHAKALLADTTAIVTSDRWWAYAICPSRAARSAGHTCGGTSTRTPKASAPRKSSASRPALCERVFWAWEVFQHTGERRELKRRSTILRRELKPALRRFSGKSPRNKYCRGMARNLLKLWPSLWTFAAIPGVRRPTTTPSAPCAEPSSTASSPSAANPKKASDASLGCSRHRSLVACNAAACTSTSSELLSASARGDPAPLLG